ncbi:MAG TPA: outer membrane lipid asymmetry maintenance protein MlaD [Stellaceae bacterium]|nr:outer membrane lipid asymmetry maintenance protein MlaD [Stellaceae bacterium]
MNRNVLETVIGAIVLLVAVIFVVFAYSAAQLRSVEGYPVTARFNRIDGIRAGGDVQISGIKVGSVTSVALDPNTFQAIVKMSIDNSVKVPDDSVAQVTSSGLLGDKFMEIVPGASDKDIPKGGEVRFTQSPTSLESLLGQAVFSMSHGGGNSGDGNGSSGESQPQAKGGGTSGAGTSGAGAAAGSALVPPLTSAPSNGAKPQ